MLIRGYPRVIAVLLGAVLLASVALAARPVAAQGEGRFSPPHSDSGIDEDGDGAYDVLRLSVRVSVTVPGPFEILAFLRDGTNTSDINYQWLRRTLTGTVTIVVDFPGHVIRAAGIDGPYVVELLLRDEWYSNDDWEAHVTGPFAASDFDGPSIVPSGPFTDFGVDTDGDGLWNLLRVRLNLTSEGERLFRAIAELDTTTSYIDSTGYTCMLPAGPQTFDLDFPGWKIRGSDGPYTVRIWHYGEDGVELALWTHVTAAYAAAEFETLPASLAPPHADRGEDSDGDGLLNSIVVDIAVSVDEPGEFSVTAFVGDALGNTWGAFGQTAELPMGSQVLTFRVPTLPILLEASDGPYTVVLFLYGSGGGSPLIEQGGHVTAAYSTSQFDPIPATLAPPHTDTVLDRDTPVDGLWDVLQLDVNVDVLDPGVYTLYARLWAGSIELTGDMRTTSLGRGQKTVTLQFSGPAMGASGFSGPYRIELTLSSEVWFNAELDRGIHTTAAYSGSGFENPPAATLEGMVRVEGSDDLAPYVDVQATNYVTGALVAGTSDEWGRYTLWLYEGDWLLSAAYWSSLQSDFVWVAVTGPQVTQDLGVAAPPQADQTMALRLNSWADAEIDWSHTWRAFSPLLGHGIDLWYGDMDGIVEWDELDTYATLVGPYPLARPPWPESTASTFLVDGRALRLDPGSWSFRLEGEGPVDAAVPLEFVGNGTYTLTGAPGPGPAHTIDVRILGDNEYEDLAYDVTAPAGFVLTPVDPPPFLEFRNASTRTITLDPGPYGCCRPAWVRLRAVVDSPPLVTSAAANPDPVEVGDETTITAAVVDSGGVASVAVEIRDPDDAVLGNFSMAETEPGTYALNFTPEDPGTFAFTVWVQDSGGGTGSAQGTFVARDMTPPTADAGLDQTVAAGSVVTFNGTGSTDNDEVAAYAWTFEEAGRTITLTGPTPSHTFSAAGTYEVVLTVTDPSGNAASDTVTIRVTGGGASDVLIVILAVVAAAAGVLGATAFFLRRRRPRRRNPEESAPERR